jgi:hypothetical protein
MAVLRPGLDRSSLVFALRVAIDTLIVVLCDFGFERVLYDGTCMANDGQLLRDYAKVGSEAAFAELVRRHLDFVYTTALCRTGGDEFLAKDVSQRVFLDLARKAPALADRSVLTGWLYTSTCFAAFVPVGIQRREVLFHFCIGARHPVSVLHPQLRWRG